jgi:hypothetical protein
MKTREIAMDQEKEIRERWFKDHNGLYSQHRTEDGHILERLIWKKADTGIYSINYHCERGTLTVWGDLGSAVYRWGGRECDILWIGGCNLDYFASKCDASESGRHYVTWNGEKARERAIEWFKDYEMEDKRADFLDSEGNCAIESKDEWREWLHENGRDYFGDEWYDGPPGWGEETHMRCHAHLIGLKMWREQTLKNDPKN